MFQEFSKNIFSQARMKEGLLAGDKVDKVDKVEFISQLTTQHRLNAALPLTALTTFTLQVLIFMKYCYLRSIL
ncbi:hypothetical protein CLI64_25545 [Nostoc sp. CENA543]|nr:hypothetical protein CLI64_25545 [Nostoc sp. CENA543]